MKQIIILEYYRKTNQYASLFAAIYEKKRGIETNTQSIGRDIEEQLKHIDDNKKVTIEVVLKVEN